MRDAVRNFLKLLQEGKVWETEADAELGEKATSVGSTGKANSGPAGEAAGAEESGPAGKAAGADIEWHDEEGGNIADWLPERYREWASVFSEEEINRLLDHTEYDHRIELVEGTVPPFGPIYLSRRKSCKHSENTSEKNLRPAKSGGPNLRPARQLSLFQSPMVACDYA
jgi:hypothetical protein